MKLKNLVILCILAFTQTAFTQDRMGHETGNGGDGVLCGNKLEFFDLYESRVKNRFLIDYSTTIGSGTLNSIFENTIKKIETINPTRANLYRGWYRAFFNETLFTNDNIQDIPDAGVIHIPQGCQLVQIAAQEEPIFNGDIRYVINEGYWNLLDNFNKVSLIIHELIIRETKTQSHLDYQHQNTRRIRYFNSFLHSYKAHTIDLRDYVELLRNSKILEANTQDGFEFSVDSQHTKFRDAKTIERAIVSSKYMNYKHDRGFFSFEGNVSINGNSYMLSDNNFAQWLDIKEFSEATFKYFGDEYTVKIINKNTRNTTYETERHNCSQRPCIVDYVIQFESNKPVELRKNGHIINCSNNNERFSFNIDIKKFECD